VIGTANDLVKKANPNCHVVVLDPNPNKTFLKGLDVTYIEETAVNGVGGLMGLFELNNHLE
jgi:hypothetical protein